MCKIPSPPNAFRDLTREEWEKLPEYIITETLSDGTQIQSYKTAAKRLKFAKWFDTEIGGRKLGGM